MAKLSVIYESEIGMGGINPIPSQAQHSHVSAPTPKNTRSTDIGGTTPDQPITNPDIYSNDYAEFDYDVDDYADDEIDIIDEPIPGCDASGPPPIIQRIVAALRAKGLLSDEIAGVVSIVEQYLHRHRLNTLSEELTNKIIDTAVETVINNRKIAPVTQLIERKLQGRTVARIRRKLNKNPKPPHTPHPELRVPHPEVLADAEDINQPSTANSSGGTSIINQEILGTVGDPVTRSLHDTGKYHLPEITAGGDWDTDNDTDEDTDDDTNDVTDEANIDDKRYYQPVTIASIIGAVGCVVSDIGDIIGSDQYHNVDTSDLPDYRPVRQIDPSYDRYRSVDRDEIEDIEDIERESRDDRAFNDNCDVATICEAIITGSPQDQDEVWFEEYQNRNTNIR